MTGPQCYNELNRAEAADAGLFVSVVQGGTCRLVHEADCIDTEAVAAMILGQFFVAGDERVASG